MAPSSLVVLPANLVVSTTPSANINDDKPMVNLPPFGACTSLANPTVASATSAALGVLTPMPCVPNIAAPAAPGSVKVMIGGMPALDMSSKIMCNWGGVIQILAPGQFKVQV
jgi:hypothetical protein